jgi:hypothetical protein
MHVYIMQFNGNTGCLYNCTGSRLEEHCLKNAVVFLVHKVLNGLGAAPDKIIIIGSVY